MAKITIKKSWVHLRSPPNKSILASVGHVNKKLK